MAGPPLTGTMNVITGREPLDWRAFVIVTLAFSSVHIQWMTAIVWGAMIALLLVKTRSLGACIIAHGVTNLLLGIYVLCTHDWAFW